MAKKGSTSSGNGAFDRVPPQSMEAERSVLGAMLLNPDAVGAALEILHDQTDGLFYAEAHQHIYDAMVGLFRKNTPVDAVTLVEQLSRDGTLEDAGGASYIAELTEAVPTSANVDYYARIVLDAAILRKLITSCNRLTVQAYESSDVNELLDQAEQEIFSIAERRQLNPIHRVSELIDASIEQIEAVIKAHKGITGMATGFTKLDEMLSGLQPSDMIILAARPSVGKTAFALNAARHAAVADGKSVLLFSLEMSKEQLVQRLLCMEGEINSVRLRTGFLAKSEFPKLQRAAGKLTEAPIYIDDTAGIGILDVRSKARRHMASHGLDLIVIDYLQLMRGAGRFENRQTEISEISRSIKSIARELRVPVLALSQLSREAEKDDTGMPKLSHLRESGAIEQDADVVLMLSRPPAHEAEGQENLIRLMVAKQRNGPTGKVDLLFDRDIQQFRNLMDGAGPPPPPEYDASGDAHAIYDDDDTPF